MTALERANALAFYVKEETSEWTGHMIPRFMQEIEAAEREAYNKAIADAAQALAQEQTEMPVSRHDAEENQVFGGTPRK